MIIIQELFIFVLTQILGIFAAYKLSGYGEAMRVGEVSSQLANLPSISLAGFLIIFFLATLFILFSLKFFKNRIFFKIIFSLGLWSGLQAILSLVLPLSLASLLALAVILLMFLVHRVWILDLVLALGLAGIGATLGLHFTPLTAILILVILSLYDFVAVYKTKHMVSMFKGLAEKKVFFCFIFPKKLKDLDTNLEKISLKKGFMFLGAGDVALPLLLAVAVLEFGLRASLAVTVGSIIGTLVNYLILTKQKEHQPLPALPMISLFSVLGFLIITLI